MFRLQAFFAPLLGAALAIPAVAFAQTVENPQPASGAEGRWERISCVEVGRRVAFDAFDVTLRSYRYDAVKLEGFNNNARVDLLRITYGSREVETIPINAELRAGSKSVAYPLKAADLVIARVEVVAHGPSRAAGEAGPSGQTASKAYVCVDGLTNEPPRIKPEPIAVRRADPGGLDVRSSIIAPARTQ